MASRCSTALVEPPSAMTTVMAFSNALLVRMSRGRMPRSSSSHDRRAGARAVVALLAGDRRLRRAVRQAQAERLDRRGHRVGGVHAAARARPGTRVRFEIGQLGVVELPGRVLADRLEHRDDVHRLVAPDARHDRAAVDEHRRPVQPRHRHHAARHVLVAAADGHEAVEALRRRRPSRSSRRSPRATPASTSSPRCPSRCRRTR